MVYFGDGAAEKALQTELANAGKTIMLAYGGGSVKRSGVYDEICGYLRETGKEIIDFAGIMPNPTYRKVQEGVALAMACVLNMALEQGVDALDSSRLYEMLQFANVAASIITTRKGALKVMPHKQEVLDLIQKGNSEKI